MITTSTLVAAPSLAPRECIASAFRCKSENGATTSARDERAADAPSNCGNENFSWSVEEIVRLHGILLDTCEEKLLNPDTPLNEVLDWLRWLFSEPEKDRLAFSFFNCVRLYGWRRTHDPDRTSAAEHEFFDNLGDSNVAFRVRAIRESARPGVNSYLIRRLQRYPAWAAEAFWSDPERWAGELDRNPQWLNRRIRAQRHAGDLFANP